MRSVKKASAKLNRGSDSVERMVRARIALLGKGALISRESFVNYYATRCGKPRNSIMRSLNSIFQKLVIEGKLSRHNDKFPYCEFTTKKWIIRPNLKASESLAGANLENQKA
jgi:hypothetical protein